jgi:hypothetical protein
MFPNTESAGFGFNVNAEPPKAEVGPDDCVNTPNEEGVSNVVVAADAWAATAPEVHVFPDGAIPNTDPTARAELLLVVAFKPNVVGWPANAEKPPPFPFPGAEVGLPNGCWPTVDAPKGPGGIPNTDPPTPESNAPVAGLMKDDRGCETWPKEDSDWG